MNFILGCRFWIKLCKLLMSPLGYFQNMKQSFKYLFHDLVNSVFILLHCFYWWFYRFSSKFVKVRVAYVAAILAPIAVPGSISSVINFLLNLWCNVSGYFSIQNEMACFPNSWGILLFRFVMSNVTMSVSESIFCGMEFKKWMLSLI